MSASRVVKPVKKRIKYRKHNGTVVALQEGNTVYKNISKSGMLKKPPAIAFNIHHVEQFHKNGVKYFRVAMYSHGFMDTFTTTLEIFDEYSIHINRTEPQLALPLWAWSKNGGPLHLPKKKQEPTHEQLSLF
jgi:hypothetical protein